MGPAGDPTGVGSPLGVVPQTVAMQQKMQRTDRLEVCLPPPVPPPPPNYMRQAPQAQHRPLFQVQSSPAGQQAQAKQSPHNNNNSPTTASCAAAVYPHQPPNTINPLHNLVYVHTYYEGPYVPIYVRT